MTKIKVYGTLALKWRNQGIYKVYRFWFKKTSIKSNNFNSNIQPQLLIHLKSIWYAGNKNSENEPRLDLNFFINEWSKYSDEGYTPEKYFEELYKLYIQYNVLKPTIDKPHTLYIYLDTQFNRIGQYMTYD